MKDKKSAETKIIKYLPVINVEVNGKRFFHFGTIDSLQCAYCMWVQPLQIIRDKDGFVTDLGVTEEHHPDTCKQK